MTETSKNFDEYNQKLIGLQRAEFNHASNHQSKMVYIQTLIAILGVISVFVTEPIYTYFIAISALFSVAVYARTSFMYRSSRSLAEQVRRAVLLVSGLGIKISPAERIEILARFSISEADGQKHEDASYYASQADCGPKRLAEMLEESAFWSADLYRCSANRAWTRFAIYISLTAAMLLALPFIGGQGWIDGARAVCVILILFMSNEILGAALAYKEAERVAAGVVTRIQCIKALQYPKDDLFLIVCDYNSAVEAAPMFPKGLYEKRKNKLNNLWAQHIEFHLAKHETKSNSTIK